MKICPNCRQICQDTDEHCGNCHYNLIGIKVLSEEERRARRRKKNLKTFFIILGILIALVVVAVIYINFADPYTLPGWMVERMQHGRVSSTVLPLLPQFMNV